MIGGIALEKFSYWGTSKETKERQRYRTALSKKLEEDNKNFWLHGKEHVEENSKDIQHYLDATVED